MSRAVDARRWFLRRWWLLLPIVVMLVLAALDWKGLTQASTPQGLFEIAVDHYRDNPHLFPFNTDFNSNGTDRLSGLTRAEGHAALEACPRKNWKKVGVVPPAYSDVQYQHLWECDAGDVLVRGRVGWEPSWGLLGVWFSACRKPDCLKPERSFDPSQYPPAKD